MPHPGSEPSPATAESTSPDYKYWAFISYSHQDNIPARKMGKSGCKRWANWLHEELETYRVPGDLRDRTTPTEEAMPERFHPCFRDEAELPTSADLAGGIHRALDRSRFLIVIASPRSAKSAYVNEEVRYFRSLGRGDRILCLIVDGEPNVRHFQKDGWTAEDECLCPALAHPLAEDGTVDQTLLLDGEPIAADVRVRDSDRPREMKERESGRALQGQLLDRMKLKLVSSLMGVKLEDLVQRDYTRKLREGRERARRLRRTLLIFGIPVALAVASVFATMHQKRAAGLAAIERRKALKKHLEALIASAESDRLTAQREIASATGSDAFAYLARAARDERAVTAELAAADAPLPKDALPDRAATARAALKALEGWRHIYPALIVKSKGIDAEFTPDGLRIDTSSGQVLDAASGKVLQDLAPPITENALADQFSADGLRMVSAAGNYPGLAHVWDIKTGKRIADIQPETNAAKLYARTHGMPPVLKIDPDQKKIPAGMMSNERVAGLVFNAARHTGTLNQITISSNGARVLTASSDGTARIWQAENGTLLMTLGGQFAKAIYGSGSSLTEMRMKNAGFKGDFRGGPVRTARFSPDQSMVVTLHTDPDSNDIRNPDCGAIWDAENGYLIAKLEIPDKKALPDGNGRDNPTRGLTDRLDLQFSPDGKLVFGACGANVYVWSAAREPNYILHNLGASWAGYLPMAIFAGNLNAISSVRLSQDGKNVVTASADHTARSWWLNDSETLIANVRAVNNHFSPVIRDDPRVMRHEGAVNSAEFSRDGKLVITTSDDNTARIWRNSPEATILHGHQGRVTGGRFNPAGTKAVTMCEDGLLRIWRLEFYHDVIYPKPVKRDHALEMKELHDWMTHRPTGPPHFTSQDPLDKITLPPPPAWFPDFLTYLGQRRFDSRGALESVPAAGWLTLREQLRATIRSSTGKDDLYLTALRRWVETE